MRTKTALQQKIAALTNNGDDILRFLAETMRGEIPGAKACHRMEAARHLMRLDASDDTLRHSCGSRNPAGQGTAGQKPPLPASHPSFLRRQESSGVGHRGAKAPSPRGRGLG